jgi:hypothetical protein
MQRVLVAYMLLELAYMDACADTHGWATLSKTILVQGPVAQYSKSLGTCHEDSFALPDLGARVFVSLSPQFCKEDVQCARGRCDCLVFVVLAMLAPACACAV